VANEKLTIEIEAKTKEAQKQIQSLENKFKDLKQDSKELNIKLSDGKKKIKELGETSQKTSKVLQNMNTALGGSSKGMALLSKQAAGLAIAYEAVSNAIETIKVAGDIEEGFLNVAKTTGLAGDELKKFEQNILDLSTTMAGVKTKELQDIATIAGQLGIKGVENLTAFTETVAKVALTTDLSAEQAAEGMAKLSNVLKEPIANTETLGDVMNELSNTTVATVGQLMDVTQRIAGTGVVLGLASDELFAYSATLKEVGISSEVAGTSMSQMFGKMLTKTEEFAKIAGVSVLEFKRMIEEDANNAVKLFLESLNKLDKYGKIKALKEIGFDGARVTTTLLKLSGATDILQKNLATANEQYEKGGSLQKEYEIMSKGVNAQLDLISNAFTELAVIIGKDLLPVVKEAITDFMEFYKSAKDSDSTLITFLSDVSDTFVSLTTTIGNTGQAISDFFTLAESKDGRGFFGRIREDIKDTAELFETATRNLTNFANNMQKNLDDTKRLSSGYKELKEALDFAKTYESLSEEAKSYYLINNDILSNTDETIAKTKEYIDNLTKQQEEIKKNKETLESKNLLTVREGELLKELNKTYLKNTGLIKQVTADLEELNNIKAQNNTSTQDQNQREIELIGTLFNTEIALKKIIERNRELEEAFKNGKTKKEKEFVELLNKEYENQVLSLEKVQQGKKKLADESIQLNDKEIESLEFYANQYKQIEETVTLTKNEELNKRAKLVEENAQKELDKSKEKGLKLAQIETENLQKIKEDLLKIEKDYQSRLGEIQKNQFDVNLEVNQAIAKLKVNEVEQKKEIDNSYSQFVQEDLQRQAEAKAQEMAKNLENKKANKEELVNVLKSQYEEEVALSKTNNENLLQSIQDKNTQIEALNQEHQQNLEKITQDGINKQKEILDTIAILEKENLKATQNEYENYRDNISSISQEIADLRTNLATQSVEENKQAIDSLIAKSQEYANKEIEVNDQIMVTKEEANNKAISFLNELAILQTQVTEQEKVEAQSLHDQKVTQLNTEIDLAKTKLEGEKAVIEALKEMYSLFSGETMQIDTTAIEEAIANIDNLRDGIEKTSETPLEINTEQAKENLQELDELDKKTTDEREQRSSTATKGSAKRITYLGNLQKQTNKEVGTDYSLYQNHIETIEAQLEDFKKNASSRTYDQNKSILDKLISDVQKHTDDQVVEDGRLVLSKEDVRNKAIEFLQEVNGLSKNLTDEQLVKEKELHDEKIRNKNFELEKLEIELVALKKTIEANAMLIAKIKGIDYSGVDTKELDALILKVRDAKTAQDDVNKTKIDVKAETKQVGTAQQKVTSLQNKAKEGAIINIDSDTTPAEKDLTQFKNKANASVTTSTHKIDIKLDEINEALAKLDNEVTTSTHKVIADLNQVNSAFMALNDTKTSSLHIVNIDASKVYALFNELNNMVTSSLHFVYGVYIPPPGMSNGGVVNSFSKGGQVPGFADGGTFSGSGRVPGYDSTDSDSVKANLEKGSFVLNRRATDIIGRDKLENLGYNTKLTKGEFVFSPREVANIGLDNLYQMNAMGLADGGVVTNNNMQTTNNNNGSSKNMNVNVYIDGVIDKSDISKMAIDGINQALKGVI
jgi:TP901 family phage tail tape measure protein